LSVSECFTLFRRDGYTLINGSKNDFGSRRNEVSDKKYRDKLYLAFSYSDDCLCGLVVRVLGYRSGGPVSIPGTTMKKK
jgi:hypothetical protein